MPSISTFSNLSSRALKNSQGKVGVRDWSSGAGTKTSGITYTDTVTAQAGDLIIVVSGVDPIDISGPTVSTVTDSVSTPYTQLSSSASISGGTTGVGLYSYVWWGVVPSGVASTLITVTVTYSATAVAKAVTAVAFQGIKKAVVNTSVSTAGTTGSSYTGTSPLVNSGDLVLAIVCAETNGLATGSSDTTRGSWSTVVGGASSGAGAGTNQAVTLQYKIVTGQGTVPVQFTGLGNGTYYTGFVFGIKAA